MFNEDILQGIRNSINEELLIVEHCSPPKYLLPFLAEDKIIFVYKQKEENELLGEEVRGPFSNETLEELDLTGQPLECPFELEKSEESFNITKTKKAQDAHYPLDLNDANDILTFVALSDISTPPVFILADGLDKNHTILVGSMKKNGWCTRSWVTTEEFSRDASRMTCVDYMIQNHNELSLINPRHTKSEVSCKYVIESVSSCHSTFLRESPGHVEMNVSWESPVFQIPLNEASVKITVECGVSNENSDLVHLWNQLILLYKYLEIIKTWKAERNVQTPYSRHTIEFPNVQQFGISQNESMPGRDLVKLLTELNQVTGTPLLGRNSNVETQSVEDIVRRITNEKKEHEFTDRLWSFLIECDSYQDVYSCFEVVFRYVQSGKSKPYIKTKNISRLARALQCCKNDSSYFEMILEPLELLIEIGIEKLKKEYISIYLLAKIATSEQLSVPSLPKFPEVNAADWVDTCSEWITWFMRVHTVLQLILVSENIIKSKMCIISLTTLTLEHYLGAKSPIQELVDPKMINVQSFTTPINTKDVLDLLNKKTPFNAWTLKLHSTTQNRQAVSIFHRNIDDVFPASLAPFDELDGMENATFTCNDVFMYHCYDFHSLSDRIE